MKCRLVLARYLFIGIGLAACSPKFSTTSPRDATFEKADIQSILGSWIYTQKEKSYHLTIRMDVEEQRIRYDETCVGSNTETGIRTVSRAIVEPGKITLIDKISGALQNGDLRCGLDFSAANYPVTVHGDTLTLQTPDGLMKFERLKDSNHF